VLLRKLQQAIDESRSLRWRLDKLQEEVEVLDARVKVLVDRWHDDSFTLLNGESALVAQRETEVETLALPALQA